MENIIDLKITEKLFDYFLDLVIMSIVYYFVFYKKQRFVKSPNLKFKKIMFIYICSVICLTLSPVITSLPFIGCHPYRMMVMKPFHALLDLKPFALLQVILNIIMLIPFGFLYPQIKEKSFFKTVSISFLFSLMIEISQPLISDIRISDVTDLIANTIGGAIGYIYFIIYNKKHLCK